VSIGKYVTDFGVIGSLMGAIGTARQTQSMRRDWRRFVVWIVWAAGLVLAISSVSMREQDSAYEASEKDRHRNVAQAEKAAKKEAKLALKKA